MHKDTFPTAATLVDRSTFRDDLVAGAEDNGAIAIYYQLTDLMRKHFPDGEMGLQFGTLEEHRGSWWPRNKIYNSRSRN